MGKQIYEKMLADIESDIKVLQKTIKRHQEKAYRHQATKERIIRIYKDMLTEQYQRRTEILENMKGYETNE